MVALVSKCVSEMVSITPLGFGTRLTLRVGCVLLEDAGHRVLVDPGHFDSKAELQQALKEHAGLALADIDTVFFTHLHFDHYNDLDFSEVGEVLVSDEEMDFIDASAQAGEGGDESYRNFLNMHYEFVAPVFMRQFMRLYRDARYDFAHVSFADRMRRVNAGEYITPNVRIVALPGHSPGLLGLACVTRWGSTLVAGDAVLSREDMCSAEGEAHLIWHRKSWLERTRAACMQFDAIVPGHGPWFCPATARVLGESTEMSNEMSNETELEINHG
jgi:glyoxylase-like metal-dependent hydrolase (beta-lactamase superfamily II)